MSDERTIVITGATDGLGKGLARELAPSGARLILHGRNEEKGKALLEELRQHQTGRAGARPRTNGELVWRRADFASLDEVRDLAEALRDEDRLDVLVNNAGIGTAGGREESAEGYELTFAVNYLAPFLLTRQLLPLIQRSAPARIVNVSSAGQAPIDFDDVMLENSYSGVQAYCQSKLALVMLTFDLAEELEGSGVTANCLHPGTYLPTNMVRRAGVEPVTPLEDGIAATMRLIASPEVEGINGHYFDGTSESAPHPQAEDPEARRRLRELSAELTGVEVSA
ncbi:MAG TPA: SDR family oxidoreductase [Solirubrobacterales bacterium]|nr:SDR family oxidoreductase [Solirubrobacterales bacterium]